MKFFIPSVKDAENAETFHEGMRWTVVEHIFPVPSRRIYQLQFRNNEEEVLAEAGADLSLNDEWVFGIFESTTDTYAVCTFSRGLARGVPFLIDKRLVIDVVDFE